MTDTPDLAPVSVSLVAVPPASASVLYGMYETFAAVGIVWPQLTGQRIHARTMQPQIVSESLKSFRTRAGVAVSPSHSFRNSGQSDIVIVPDLELSAEGDPGTGEEPVRWLRDQFEGGATVCSVCTGSVLLAEAGLLDNLEATTHWSAAQIFPSRFPAVRLRPECMLLPAGPEHRIVTGGGFSAWTDLVLYLIARYSGPDEARRIAKVFLYGDRSDGQLPFAAIARPRQHEDSVIADCQSWIAEHYEQANPVAALVARSGLAPRTFARRFRQATGYAPIEYVQTLRIEEAKQLLESTDEAVDEVAASVGYDDDGSFRRLFKRLTGISPGKYRQRFRMTHIISG